ncbi:hypothetical protein FWK35_00013922 [Aphis craccivora]|uniref:Uncharacterized protein n=1 Tax=Aphis craccivora TaxID=307492 RepID=A0A6G0YYG6_APHCR|nr:hypothetical protein FWK35_00013922 [Aphis craccivora]
MKGQKKRIKVTILTINRLATFVSYNIVLYRRSCTLTYLRLKIFIGIHRDIISLANQITVFMFLKLLHNLVNVAV